MTNKEFEVTEDHLKLLKRMYIGWEDCEYGAPAVDCKRPYGNSSVAHDIYEILEWEVPVDEYGDPDISYSDERARVIHLEMQTVLQILVNNLSIKPGKYVATRYGVDWQKID